MPNLRQYQSDLINSVQKEWDSGGRRVMVVLPMGCGKTVVAASIAKNFDKKGMFIAHRVELLGQISTQLAREGIYHQLITPKDSSLHRKICKLHLKKVGKIYLREGANWFVAGVDTVMRMENDTRWKQIKLVIIDEAHHCIENNKWGKVIQFTPDAKLLGFTATPCRSDGKPLNLFDRMVEGIPMRKAIEEGYLCDYQILCPKTSDLDLSNVIVSQVTGDYNANQIKKAIHNSRHIVGNIVKEYLRHAKGKLGVTFAVDVEHATSIAIAFRKNGVAAEVIHAKTPPELRDSLLGQFERKEILQLVNVDLFGEGFDLPAIQVISFARPTMSFLVYCQQFGRVLRLLIDDGHMAAWDTYSINERKSIIVKSKKPFGIIIDHVGNVIEHGFPDSPRNWSLLGKLRSNDTGMKAIPLRSCLNLKCLKVYERNKLACPYCGKPIPISKLADEPKTVDGDLELLTIDVLNELRKAIKKIDSPVQMPTNVEKYVRVSIMKKHMERQLAQKELRYSIAVWAACHPDNETRENHKLFYLMFNTTVLDAMALGTKQAKELNERIMVAISNTIERKQEGCSFV